MVRMEDYLPRLRLRPIGRPRANGTCLAQSFLAQMALYITTTCRVRERLLSDVLLRPMSRWSRPCDVPNAPTHSRAFEDLSEAKLLTRIHEALIEHGYAGEQVRHISRDSTAIKARQ